MLKLFHEESYFKLWSSAKLNVLVIVIKSSNITAAFALDEVQGVQSQCLSCTYSDKTVQIETGKSVISDTSSVLTITNKVLQKNLLAKLRQMIGMLLV